MNPSNLTPEIIATKIWEWHKETRKIASGSIIEIWIGPTPKESGLMLSSTGSVTGLPTFLEPEWTGPLLAKAGEIGKYDLFFSGEDFGFWFNRIGGTNTHCSPFLNLAIAGAILEAIGE
ncbi:hypothetical protein [Leptospira johnsonii]|uniref:Uncharacterized protein n=1 Tax=Leptospira johnsonii TaxID=1917820 RepID=A0A2P2D7P9_9LEPT|nr:hypothetical protein [Leptospira johnsonii]GBF40659.1 hypothetical protein LPTSP1_36770 [Leptospira johnsonii]